MGDVITNMKVRFGADTKQYRKGMNEAKEATETLKGEAGGIFASFAEAIGINLDSITKSTDIAKSGFKLFGGGVKDAGASSSFFVKGLKLIKGALIATGIGAFVVVIASVVAAFKRFDDYTEAFGAKMAGMKAAVDVFLDRFAKMGEVVIKLFSGGSLKEAINGVKEAFAGMGDEMKVEMKQAEALKQALWDLEDRSKMFEAQQAASNTELLRLREISKDVMKSDSERLSAVINANKIEEAMTAKKVSLADEELAASLELIDVNSQKLQLNQEALDLIDKIRKGTISVADAENQVKNMKMSSAASGESLYAVIDKIVAREQALQESYTVRIKLQKEENAIRTDIANKQIKALNSEAALKREIADSDKLAYADRYKLVEDAIKLDEKALKMQLDTFQIDDSTYKTEVERLYKDLRKLIEEQNKALTSDLAKLKPIDLTPKLELETSKLQSINSKNEEAVANLVRNQEVAKTVGSELDKATANSLENMAVGFGELLGEMANGSANFSDIGTMVLSSLADLAISVGKIAIATGIAVSGIKTALESMNPAIAIAGGVALIAIGSAVKGALSSAASGASSSASSISSVSNSSSSSNSMLRSAPIRVHVTGEFRQKGKDLSAVIDQYGVSKSVRG